MRCVKAVSPVATLIGNDTDLTKYQPGYDAENQRIPTPRYEALSLMSCSTRVYTAFSLVTTLWLRLALLEPVSKLWV